MLGALDYETADGAFRIGRSYRSFQVGAAIDGYRLPRSQPRGLTGGWNFNFGYELQLGTFSGSPSSPSAKVGVLLPDGTGYGFTLNSNGEWVASTSLGLGNAAKDLTLEFVGPLPSDLSGIKDSVSTWKLTDGNDVTWTFETRTIPNSSNYETAWPVGRELRNGYSWTFAYNSDSSLASITDSYGRTATFEWFDYYITSLVPAPSGYLPFPLAIKSIDLPDGTSLEYTYDPVPATAPPSSSMIKRLVKVERLSSSDAVLDSVTYLYEDGRYQSHITGVVDNRGIRVATYSYDGEARAVTSEGANGANFNQVVFGTSGTSRTSSATNALGKVTNYTFTKFGTHDYRLTDIDGEASANCLASTQSIGYGTDTFVNETIDAEGRVTTTIRDARGRPTSITEADGETEERTTTITWHTTWNVPTTVVRPNLTETYTYDAYGHLASLTRTDTTSQTAPYSTNGDSRTYSYSWDSNGRLLSVNGPLPDDGAGNDDLTTFTYDTLGNLLTSTDALGHVTSLGSYDTNGRPGTMTDANGIVTSFTYDELGRVETITVEHPSDSQLNATTTIAYDEVGQVVGLTLPSTDTLITDYDGAGRVASIRAASGERWDYTYDAMGNVIGETVRRSNGTVSVDMGSRFDELGRIIASILGSSGHPARLGYDKVGNTTSSTTPNGNATTAAFDALDRVVSTVAPDSGSTSLAYDGADNQLSYTDPISVTTQFVYNGFGDIIQESSPDRGTSTYWYDDAGRMIEYTDGRGQTIDYTRDYLGRVTQMVPQGRPASETVTYSWDSGGLSGSYEVGRLAKVVDGSGTTSFQYDHRGNLLAKQQVIGTTTNAQLAYTYDLADRITQITYPSGRLVKYDYDSKGRISAVSTKASSSVTSWTVLADSYSYDPFGAVAEAELGNGLTVENERRDDGRLASRRLYETTGGANLSHLSYGYDADGNISSLSDEVDSSKSVIYGYDNMGHLSLAVVSDGGASAESYSYTSGTNRLASATDASGARTVTYDDRGNSVGEVRPGSITATVGYDGYGRLTSYDRTDVGTNSFTYNGLDERVIMSLQTAGVRRFIYDPSGRVMGEYGASAVDVEVEFIWAEPQVGGNGSPFGGGDGLGGYMPLAVATPDSGGVIQINWVHGNHLGVPILITDAAGNEAVTPNDYQMPGFPGQSQVFGDLYYNMYRDYDPASGRYIQADPIGLAGGSNPYLYANGNPINVVDPRGLAWQHLPAGKWIDCGAGCRIRIDRVLINGKIKRHLHWECKGKKGECGEFGEESHGDTWESAPQRIKDCARKNGFNGEDTPVSTPSQPIDDGADLKTFAGVGLGLGAALCLIAEPCGGIVATALGLGSMVAVGAN